MSSKNRVIISYLFKETKATLITIIDVEPYYEGTANVKYMADGVIKVTVIEYQDLFNHACEILDDTGNKSAKI